MFTLVVIKYMKASVKTREIFNEKATVDISLDFMNNEALSEEEKNIKIMICKVVSFLLRQFSLK